MLIIEGNSLLGKVGVMREDSSATDSSRASCLNILPEAGTSVRRGR